MQSQLALPRYAVLSCCGTPVVTQIEQEPLQYFSTTVPAGPRCFYSQRLIQRSLAMLGHRLGTQWAQLAYRVQISRRNATDISSHQ